MNKLIFILLSLVIVFIQTSNIKLLTESTPYQFTVSNKSRIMYRVIPHKFKASNIILKMKSATSGCATIYYQAGSVASENSYYQKTSIVNSFISAAYRPIKCDWYMTVVSNKASACSYEVSYVNTGTTTCCQTECVVSSASNTRKNMKSIVLIYLIGSLIKFLF